jgi:hypothetical protein
MFFLPKWSYCSGSYVGPINWDTDKYYLMEQDKYLRL